MQRLSKSFGEIGYRSNSSLAKPGESACIQSPIGDFDMNVAIYIRSLPGLFLILLLAACSPSKHHYPKYEVVQFETYDVPAKSQITARIILKDTINKRIVEEVLNSNFSFYCKKGMKYHDKPTHVFVYVYDSLTDYKKNGTNWLGMVSRIMNEDKGIELNPDLK